MIPQSNPKANYLAHREAIDAGVRRVLESGWFILGQEVKAFEAEFAAYHGVSHALGVASGTDAIELALRGCGVGAGHVVFTVSHTAVATAVAIERAGATPVFIDIDPATYAMDAASLEEAIAKIKRGTVKGITGTPKAIVPVHLYGHPADLNAIMDIAKRHDLIVIEDCAQAHGATYNGRKVGTFGRAAAFSFYPTKNLGALGDGGAIVTADSAVAEQIRVVREYGWRERYVSDIPGINSRLDEMQAAMLRPKLAHLDKDNARRKAVAAQYDRGLNDKRIGKPAVRAGCGHVYHQYVVRVPADARDAFRTHLKDSGVGTLIHYPMPVHQQPAYSTRLPRVVSLSHTELAAREVVSLPMFPELTDQQVAEVMKAVGKWPVPELARR